VQVGTARTAGRVAAQASLRILGVGLDFDLISERLRLGPSDTHRKGDHGVISRPYPSDMWLFESPLPRSEPLDTHILWLRRVLSPRYESLRAFMKEYDVSVYCGITVEGTSCSFTISPEALGVFVELDIPLDLTYIFTGYSEPACSEGLGGEDAAVSKRPGTTGTVESACEVELRVPGGVRKLGEGSVLTPSGVSESLRVPVDRGAAPEEHLRWLAGFLEEGAHVISSWRKSSSVLVRCELGVENDYGEFNLSGTAMAPLVRSGIPLEFCFSLLQ
jgi:Domain of unknown function (DUF4279)